MSLTKLRHDSKTCEILEWDSAFFGYRIARYQPPRCAPSDLSAMRSECAAGQIECVYILLDGSDNESINNLRETRASLVDIRVTFGADVRSAGGPESVSRPAIRVRPAIGSDVPGLTHIATTSHRDTRFYADKHFASEQCDRLYEVWIENSCHGYADAVLVAEDRGGQLAGYVTCHKGAAATGHIGLFAVKEDARGRGIGRALLTASLTWFSNNGLTTMTVATQLRNAGALRIYGQAGLLISSVGLWFHLWPRDGHV
jgi:ribosomal protein S18 acetylase RimI-like enzyme